MNFREKLENRIDKLELEVKVFEEIVKEHPKARLAGALEKRQYKLKFAKEDLEELDEYVSSILRQADITRSNMGK